MSSGTKPALSRRIVLTGAAALAAGPAAAQTPGWPDRPITLVVPFLAGGSTDIAGRILADRLGPLLGGRVIIENRAGAGGSVGADYVRRQPPDGYTLLLGTASSHGTNAVTMAETTRYDPVADFTPIALLGGAPLVLIVPAASPLTTAAALFAEIRNRPGALSWATSGTGNIGHLSGAQMLAQAAGGGTPLRAEHISYRGGAQVMEALAKNEVQFSVEPLASATPHLRDGLSRGLAVTSPARHPLFLTIPTLAESGLAGFDATTWNVLIGPRAMPTAITAAVNRATLAVLADPAARERLSLAGLDPAEPTTPDTTRDFLVAELAKFRRIMESGTLGIQ